MKRRSSHRTSADGAFTILEVLVAMAVFLMMALMVVSLVDGTMRVTSQSQRRINADDGTRQALDRMTADFSHAIVRADLPVRIEKNASNDSITFFAKAEGYSPGRGISMIGYRVSTKGLERGAEATGWTNSALGFTTVSAAIANPTYLQIADTNYETVAPEIFRLEFAFLMGDGAISNSAVGSSVVSIASSPRTSTTNTIRGVIVGVATLDTRVRKMFPNPLVFPDAANNVDILSGWNANISNASLPLPVRESLRIYKRTLLINN
jgi:hypothetical protein